MAQQAFPYEYQTDFGEAEERARLAQALIQRGQQIRPPTGRMVSGIFVPAHPLEHLASVLSQAYGSYMLSKAAQQRNDVLRRMAADEASERARIAGMMTGSLPQSAPGDYGPGEAPTVGPQTSVPPDPVGAVRTALGSKFSSIRDFGDKLRQQLTDQFRVAAQHATNKSVIAAGGDPNKLVAGEVSGPVNLAPPGQPPVWGYFDQNGKPIPLPFPPSPAATTNVTVGDKTEGTIIAKAFEHVNSPKVQETVTNAMKALDAGTAAWNLLATVPLNLGVDSTIKTFAQSLGQIVKKEPDPRIAGTQLYQSFIIPQIGNIIKMFGSGTAISDADRKAAEEALAKATNQPAMLHVALAYSLRAAYKELMQYERELRTYGRVAERMGVDPELFTVRIPSRYGFTVPASVPGFPEDIFDDAAMADWAKRIVINPPPPVTNEDIKRQNRQEALKRWLPNR